MNIFLVRRRWIILLSKHAELIHRFVKIHTQVQQSFNKQGISVHLIPIEESSYLPSKKEPCTHIGINCRVASTTQWIEGRLPLSSRGSCEGAIYCLGFRSSALRLLPFFLCRWENAFTFRLTNVCSI